jgi:hypothetical protein
VLGGGRSVVRGAATIELRRDEVLDQLLTGFLPQVDPDDRPAHDRRHGLRELGLPYEPDPAITRHLAAFLGGAGESGQLARPDAVLFNGGFFTPDLARQRLVDTLGRWFGEAPDVLANAHPESAVAVGAAYYAALRTGPPERRRLLVRAGSPRTYYIALQDESPSPDAVRALTVMPRGTDEGTRLDLPDRRFRVVTNRPIAFILYSSTTREDAHGSIVVFGPDDEVHRHAALAAVLRFGKRSRHAEVDVTLSVIFTELGSLELWLEAPETGHRWRLQFQVRSRPAVDDGETEGPADSVVLPEGATERAHALIRSVFDPAPGSTPGAPETLVGDLEAVLGYGKQVWPLEAIRTFCDALLSASVGREKGAPFEARWLNLTGFCLRPGFGAAADPWRIGEIRKVYTAGLAFAKDVQCQVEWLVLWQRVAGGFSAGQQRELAQRLFGNLGVGTRKPPRLNPQIERESWRLLASLERLEVPMRVRIGDELAPRVRRDPRNASLVWALGRVGARIPFYGPLDRVVPPHAASPWLDVLLSVHPFTLDAAGAVAQLAAATGDVERDLDAPSRDAAANRLQRVPGADDLIALVTDGARERRVTQGLQYFGETLPHGLRLSE